LPADLIEAELFGAEAGAYTGAAKKRIGRFEAADGGTLFLDEIGNLSADGQAKLLRVIQSGEYQRLGSSQTRTAKVRIISATNSDLEAAIRRKAFREDLYYRLNVIELQVPPLANRREDIMPLADAFLDDAHRLSPASEKALFRYPWPGNVRELRNVIRRACLLASDPVIDADDLGLATQSGATHEDPDEKSIRDALADAEGVVSRAARALGISRQALYRRMEKYGLTNDGR
jgi:DNA-binding NtrC family response regulator